MRFLHATILNQVNPYLQFKMKKGTVNLSFLDFMTTKTETYKITMTLKTLMQLFGK